jgi:hypothetical protein
LDRGSIAEVRCGERKEMCCHVGVPTDMFLNIAEFALCYYENVFSHGIKKKCFVY